MKFKITFYLLCCSLLLTACDGSAHKHSAESWERNVSTHWQECECGETFNLGEHTLENDECSACKSEIYTYDGGADIYNYNINGDLEKISCYDGDGNIISESITDIEYDELFNLLYDAASKPLTINSYVIQGSGRNKETASIIGVPLSVIVLEESSIEKAQYLLKDIKEIDLSSLHYNINFYLDIIPSTVKQ